MRLLNVWLKGSDAAGGIGDATAANQTSQITQETALNTILGLIADAAAAVGGTGTQSAKLRLMTTQLDTIQKALKLDEYETVAASQTAQVMGTTGAIGDTIAGILVIPATTSPGLVTLLDNAISIPMFVGGAASIVALTPFYIMLNIKSVSGAWKITTGANVSCLVMGDFT